MSQPPYPLTPCFVAANNKLTLLEPCLLRESYHDSARGACEENINICGVNYLIPTMLSVSSENSLTVTDATLSHEHYLPNTMIIITKFLWLCIISHAD